MVYLDSIQGVITETTQVWSSIVGSNWKTIKDIRELHEFLSPNQYGGNVGISLLDLMVQGSSSGGLAGSGGGSRNSQDIGRDWLVSWMDNEQ